jgi:hypothetical protein
MRSIGNLTLPALWFDHLPDQAGANGEIFLQGATLFVVDTPLDFDFGHEPGHDRVVIEFPQGESMRLD